MPITYVSSGMVFDFCFEIRSEEGFFNSDQLAALNAATHDFLGITAVRCVRSSRHSLLYVITNPVGGIPCDPVRRFPRNCPDKDSDSDTA